MSGFKNADTFILSTFASYGSANGMFEDLIEEGDIDEDEFKETKEYNGFSKEGKDLLYLGKKVTLINHELTYIDGEPTDRYIFEWNGEYWLMDNYHDSWGGCDDTMYFRQVTLKTKTVNYYE